MLSDIRLYCKWTVIETAQYWYKNRSMEQTRESRNKPMWSINLWEMREQNAMEKRQPLLISDAGETGQLQGKNENIFSHHMQQ